MLCALRELSREPTVMPWSFLKGLHWDNMLNFMEATGFASSGEEFLMIVYPRQAERCECQHQLVFLLRNHLLVLISDGWPLDQHWPQGRWREEERQTTCYVSYWFWIILSGDQGLMTAIKCLFSEYFWVGDDPEQPSTWTRCSPWWKESFHNCPE